MLARSWGVPCQRRGYKVRGTMMVRPSVRSTVRESSLTATCRALGSDSTTEELTPFLQQKLLMLLDKPGNLVQFDSAESAGPCERDWVQPELGDLVLVP